ncbi:hypothetical protein J529_1054 [Acinetobacter baumannii 99063]|uniref:Uncharacterized protein n=1 Tax=Acinetobacter baumannii 99063 TaxID=1310630 RepID=A0A009SFT4_ACIBA|nr:hypothetical protein J533_0320 [Acinetobacter baumannii 4749]EXC52626.1 hypothetical protein J529_1054 [Acinetobacter baumannii 99063]EXC95035.1 hypothetical protein J484_1525 [Acinetobacter baumannii 1051830]
MSFISIQQQITVFQKKSLHLQGIFNKKQQINAFLKQPSR